MQPKEGMYRNGQSLFFPLLWTIAISISEPCLKDLDRKSFIYVGKLLGARVKRHSNEEAYAMTTTTPRTTSHKWNFYRPVQHANDSRHVVGINMQWQRPIPNGNKKNEQNNPRLCSLSSDYLKVSHFMFLFSIGRQKNVQRFIAHVHSYCFCSLDLLFGDVVVCLLACNL